jgi:hypothetical protein
MTRSPNRRRLHRPGRNCSCVTPVVRSDARCQTCGGLIRSDHLYGIEPDGRTVRQLDPKAHPLAGCAANH